MKIIWLKSLLKGLQPSHWKGHRWMISSRERAIHFNFIREKVVSLKRIWCYLFQVNLLVECSMILVNLSVRFKWDWFCTWHCRVHLLQSHSWNFRLLGSEWWSIFGFEYAVFKSLWRSVMHHINIFYFSSIFLINFVWYCG